MSPALSPRNPRLSEVRRLLSSVSARRQHGRFVVEGPRLLAEALAASWPIIEVFVEDPSAWPGATLVRPGTLDRLGDAETSQGVLAVVAAPPLVLPQPQAERLPGPEREPHPGTTPRRDAQPLPGPTPTLRSVSVPASGFVSGAAGLIGAVGGAGKRDQEARMGADPTVLVLVDVADPGNAGTMVRSAAAAGVAAVIFAGHSVDPLSPKVVRASAGSLFRVPVAVASVDGVFEWADRAGLAVWATVPAHHPDAKDLYATGFDGGVALLLGSEAHGLDPEVLARVGPRVVAVPTVGGVESLNVAMAATVVAFELLRRRRAAAEGSTTEDWGDRGRKAVTGANRLDAQMGAGQASGHDR